MVIESEGPESCWRGIPPVVVVGTEQVDTHETSLHRSVVGMLVDFTDAAPSSQFADSEKRGAQFSLAPEKGGTASSLLGEGPRHGSGHG